MPQPARSTLVAYAAIAVVVAVLGLRWLDRDARQSSSGSSSRVAGSAEAAGSSPRAAPPDSLAAGSTDGASSPQNEGDVGLERAPAPKLVVHVVGAVRSPGVYRLSSGSRVADAVKRAGGVAHGADTAAINLAAKLTDGQQVALPRRAERGLNANGAPPDGTAAPAQAPPVSAAGPVSLASATLEQLDTLDGVGPATAKKILDWRAKSGGFGSVDDLAEIPGIGPKKLESLRAQVVP